MTGGHGGRNYAHFTHASDAFGLDGFAGLRRFRAKVLLNGIEIARGAGPRARNRKTRIAAD